jgi:putative Mn2+ efflux pump MntP
LLLGQWLGDFVGALAAYVATEIILIVGLLAVRETLSDDRHELTEAEPCRPLIVITLSVSLPCWASRLGGASGRNSGRARNLAAGVVLMLLGVVLALSEATDICLL